MTTKQEADRQGEEIVKFTNVMPDDPEWTAHIKIMNDWQNPDRILRDIIQYARSGKFYPADMHVDLIEQYIRRRDERLEVRARLDEIERASVHLGITYRNDRVIGLTDKLRSLDGEVTE